MIWPAPERATISIHTAGSVLRLPLRDPVPADDALRPFGPPEGAAPLDKEVLEEPDAFWEIVEDARTGRMEMRLADGEGTVRLTANDLITRSQGYESYRVTPGDNTSAVGETSWHYGLERGEWKIASRTETRLTADRTHFIVRARLRAWEGETLVHEESWDERIPRVCV
jgi:hypothetical protein